MKNLKSQSEKPSEHRENKLKGEFPNLTPRRGSLPVDYSRPTLKSPKAPKFPLSSPTTPRSTSPRESNFNLFSPIAEEVDIERTDEILQGLLNRGQRASDSLLNRLLDQKERLLTEQEQKIKKLEVEKEQLLEEKEEFKQNQNRQSHLLNKQNQRLELLEREKKESDDDFYQITQKNDKLKQDLNQERLKSQQLERRLSNEVQENYRLKESQEQTNSILLGKINELTQLKKLKREEREQLQQIITHQSEVYETEKKEREEKFAQTVNNLRTFQLKADISSRFKRTHKPALSLGNLPISQGNSPRNSYIIEDDRIIFPGSPGPLSSELKQKGYSEKGGLISSEFTTTPTNYEDNDPFETNRGRTKKRSNSPFFGSNSFSQSEEIHSAEQENINQTIEELLTLADNSVEQINNQQELLSENETLKENQLQLEKAFKDLADERIEHERSLQLFNQKELV